MSWLGGTAEESAHRQLAALNAKFEKYSRSEFQTDRQKAFKLLTKIKRIERELVNLKLPFDMSRR